jgi:hypothetical protein
LLASLRKLTRTVAEQIKREAEARAKRKHFHRCQKSFAYFLRHFAWTADGGGVKIDPWPWQVDLARQLPKFKRVLCLKARQLGISWIAAAYALWTALFQRGALVLLVSQTEDDAIELLSKVLFIFENLPAWMRPEREDWATNTRCLKFKKQRSAVVALPSTPRAGRGRTARLVVADEHAFHSWATANYNALSPSIDAGGQFLSISTADGVGNFFADVCALASQNCPWVRPVQNADGSWRLVPQLRTVGIGPDAWLPLFLPYEIRPGREGDWWERKKAAHPKPREFFQEYPRDPDEAFVQTGRPRFDSDNLKAHRKLCRLPLPRREWPAALRTWSPDELRVFEVPRPGHRYVAGADVAEGLEHGDFSDLCVLDFDHESGKPTEVLSLHGHWAPDEYARLIVEISKLYPGRYAIERNNHGLACILWAKKLGLKGMYFERAVIAKSGQQVEPEKPGWLTTNVTKPLMIDELEMTCRQFGVVWSDELAIQELTWYQTLKDGSTGAPAGKWDDRVMSRAIAVQMFKHLPPKATAPLPGPDLTGPILSGGMNMRL